MMSTRRVNVNIAKPKLGNHERRSPRRTKTPSSNELKNKCKFSPKGKRKLDFPLKAKKGPLSGKLFYLDIPGSRVNQLKTAIERLGGIVEEFFRKEVTYLVTNRGECGKSPSSQSVPSPGTPSPIPITRSSSIKNYAAASPMSTDSPQSIEAPQTQAANSTTRGKSIAKRSTGYMKGPIDILSNAITWGVSIVHADHILKWISQQRGAAKKNTSSPSERVTQTKIPKVVALQETYIKVEDLGFTYRPLIHEFRVWPELTFDRSNVCPFDPPRRRSSENNIIKKECRNETKIVKKPSIHERPKHGYCECCEVRYADLDTHLRGKQHREFARKDSNYTSLDKAISEGPQIGDLLREIQLRKSNGSQDIVSAEEKTTLQPVGCVDTDDICNDDVFLLSTPRSSRRNKMDVSDHTPPSKENLSNNEAQQMSPIMDADENHNNRQKTNSVSKPCTPKKLVKKTVSEFGLSVIDAEDESPQSRPLTRLQKATFNSSSPCEYKHFLSVVKTSERENSDKTTSVSKIQETERRSTSINENKRKSTEVTEEHNEFDILECSNNSRDNRDDTALNGVGNEHGVLRKSTRKAISCQSVTTKRENQSEAEVQLSQDERNKEVEYKHRTSKRNPRKIYSKKVVDQTHSTSTKEDNNEKTNESKRPKRNAVAKIDVCNETTALQNPMPGFNTDDSLVTSLGRNHKTIVGVDDNSVINGSKASDEQEEIGENHDLEKCIEKHDNVYFDLSDTEGGIQHSDDLPCLKIPSKNISNDNCLLAICPGALIEAENTPTVRSSRRRKSVVGNCQLSPITPCNLEGEYSVRSSCSEDIEFLPSGLRIYSSFGSAMVSVSKDVNCLVDRIEKEFNADGDNEVDPQSNAPSDCEILKGKDAVSKDINRLVDRIEKEFNADGDNEVDPQSNAPSDYEILKGEDTQASRNLKSKEVFLDIPKDQIDNADLQISLTYLNVDAISAARGKDEDSCVNVKRKRKLNDQEEPTRKCKRLSVATNDSDFQQDDFVESLSNGETFEYAVQETYRSSVAERVKLNRAIFESLQECNSSGVNVMEPVSSPQVKSKCRKRKNLLLSSPFAEITNTFKKKRERAKSERKIRTSPRSIGQPDRNGSQPPRSACFTPNDPFRFDDY